MQHKMGFKSLAETSLAEGDVCSRWLCLSKESLPQLLPSSWCPVVIVSTCLLINSNFWVIDFHDNKVGDSGEHGLSAGKGVLLHSNEGFSQCEHGLWWLPLQLETTVVFRNNGKKFSAVLRAWDQGLFLL